MIPYIDLNFQLPRPTSTHIIPLDFQEASGLIFAFQLAAQALGMIQARTAITEVIDQTLSVCDVQSWSVLLPAQTAANINRLRNIQAQFASTWRERLELMDT